MITDFFSHKIHSSDDDWPDKLVEIAFLFSEFDGQIYDRAAIEARLLRISPRASFAARDRSKFRDEVSAYPAYLGLYHLRLSSSGWIVQLSETTKRLLVREEPDVASFLRLQLPLLQYPTGIGVRYSERDCHFQANARDRILRFVGNGVHLAPLRLITIALLADAELRGVALQNARVTFSEVFALANQLEIYTTIKPETPLVKAYLSRVRAGALLPPENFESRFHLLQHLELFEIGSGAIKLRGSASELDQADLENKVRAIANIENVFTGFDGATNGDNLAAVIKSGAWANYFDGIATLEGGVVEVLTSDLVEAMSSGIGAPAPTPEPLPLAYPLRPRSETLPTPTRASRPRELADPEATRILRQRRNFIHKILVDKVDEQLRLLGAEPMESQHIDLYAQIPDDGSCVFEVKSGGPNLLAQIRKGLSQLYEYRFRYKNELAAPVTLCMVLPEQPISLPWVEEYLCDDREICLFWFTENGEVEYPAQCSDQMEAIFSGV